VHPSSAEIGIDESRQHLKCLHRTYSKKADDGFAEVFLSWVSVLLCWVSERIQWKIHNTHVISRGQNIDFFFDN